MASPGDVIRLSGLVMLMISGLTAMLPIFLLCSLKMRLFTFATLEASEIDHTHIPAVPASPASMMVDPARCLEKKSGSRSPVSINGNAITEDTTRQLAAPIRNPNPLPPSPDTIWPNPGINSDATAAPAGL